jgi:diguanylate cyclase (GGDEF)-like protein
MTLIIFNLSLQVNAEVHDSKNILILNSYHKGFTWTDDQVTGILDSLSSLNTNHSTSVEYMDWKRFSSKENLDNIYNNLKYKYSKEKIDVIVCTDDSAFNFALKNRKEIFSDAPIVFSGVNSTGLSEIGNSYNNYTGVLEEVDPELTIRAALKINPSIKNIYLVYDNTESGISTGELCIKAANTIDSTLNVISLNNVPSEDIINKMSTASKDSIILVTTYFKDTNGTNIDHQKFCNKLSAAASIPIFHLYDFALGNGVLGGNLIIGKLQGQEAGILAKRILSGEQAFSIPIISKKTNEFTFDYKMLQHFNIHNSSLPNGSIIINKPFSFMQTYRNLVYTVLIIFFLLISFTIILLFYIKKIAGMKNKLEENNEELTQLYEELTATEEELRAQFSEITDNNIKLEEYSTKLSHLAYHDALTGLYNRLYLYEKLDVELSTTSNAAILFIDLDNFKFVNDAFGHVVGDELLKAIGSRLLKLSDENNMLIRLGGDEFVFYCKDIHSSLTAESFAQKIINTFEEQFKINNNSLIVTISIGIALFPENGESIEVLLSHADMAMYNVKDNGKNGYYFFNSILKDELLLRVNIENNFKYAITKNEFILYYQPQINIFSNEIDGFEALIRWKNPELGMISPTKFISIAEETGFILTLGEWILRSACIFIKDLNQRKGTEFKISVNISIIQLLQDDFVSIVKEILADTSLDPELLELELTESVIMDSSEVVVCKIKDLRSLGIRIALDDFGTGYSSLSYLRNIPITTLKIDKLFIDDISKESNTTVTDTIIELGHKMNLSIVAEGVETKEQLSYLKRNGCDRIQGYLFYKPLSPTDLEKALINHKGLVKC